MANWQGMARSNYFRVKDRAAFAEAMDEAGCCVQDEDGDGGAVMIYPDDSNCDDGGWPCVPVDADADEAEYIDIPALVAEHIVEDDVAILIECGWERLRYLSGRAIAVDSKGQVTAVDLNDIYAQAAGMRPQKRLTKAEY